MLIAAGLLLLVLGIACGALLVLAPLGLVTATPGLTLWVLFPLFSVAGYLLAAAPADDAKVPALSRGAGVLLLALALVAAVGLVLHGSAMREAQGGPLPLWYVMAVGLVLGVMGLASHRRA